MFAPALQPTTLSSWKIRGTTRQRYSNSGSGAREWFRPPYSPTLNPIEQVLAKLKNQLRKAQERASDRIGQLLWASGRGVRKLFAKSGYRFIAK